jgi:acetyl esterase
VLSSDQLRARFEPALMRGLAGLPERLLRALVGEAVVIDGQQLDLEVQLFLKRAALLGGPDLESLPVAQARARMLSTRRILAGPELPMEVQRIEIPGAGGPIPARLYAPDSAADVGPLLVYYHGGGFVIGELDTHDSDCRFLAHHAGLRVLSVGYRLAPEHRFPAGYDDAIAAFRYAADHADELGADPARIAVGGDSAGGNLAAGVAQRGAREAASNGGAVPVFQLLIYPWLDLSSKRRSHQLFAEGYYLSVPELEWFADLYVENPDELRDPRCSPLLAHDLHGVAPAYVITAGFDPLRDEGEEYVARLRSVGVPVVLRRHPGLIHGFLNMLGTGRVARDALAEAAGALSMGVAS